MFIVLGAARAKAYYPADATIQQAASQIICQVRNQLAYVQPSTDAAYFRGLSAAARTRPARRTHSTRSILLVEQLGFYGGGAAATVFSHWLERSRWPTATYLTARPITGDSANSFQAAFTSLYPLELQPAYRAAPAWQDQVAAVRDSNGAWTDDNGPRYNTVFSAGDNALGLGRVPADNLGNHPGDVTSLPALMAICSIGRTPEAVGAYNAYRRGARQTFRGGASILYRRSNVDQSYQPDSAALVDVVLGGLGLAELIQPGLTTQVLAVPQLPCAPPCDANCDASTIPPVLNVSDFACFLNRFAAGDSYANCDGELGPAGPERQRLRVLPESVRRGLFLIRRSGPAALPHDEVRGQLPQDHRCAGPFDAFDERADHRRADLHEGHAHAREAGPEQRGQAAVIEPHQPCIARHLQASGTERIEHPQGDFVVPGHHADRRAPGCGQPLEQSAAQVRPHSGE
jgi:hypothetical protein